MYSASGPAIAEDYQQIEVADGEGFPLEAPPSAEFPIEPNAASGFSDSGRAFGKEPGQNPFEKNPNEQLPTDSPEPSPTAPSLNPADHLKNIAEKFDIDVSNLKVKFSATEAGRLDAITGKLYHKTQDGEEADLGELFAQSGATAEEKANFEIRAVELASEGVSYDINFLSKDEVEILVHLIVDGIYYTTTLSAKIEPIKPVEKLPGQTTIDNLQDLLDDPDDLLERPAEQGEDTSAHKLTTEPASKATATKAPEKTSNDGPKIGEKIQTRPAFAPTQPEGHSAKLNTVKTESPTAIEILAGIGSSQPEQGTIFRGEEGISLIIEVTEDYDETDAAIAAQRARPIVARRAPIPVTPQNSPLLEFMPAPAETVNAEINIPAEAQPAEAQAIRLEAGPEVLFGQTEGIAIDDDVDEGLKTSEMVGSIVVNKNTHETAEAGKIKVAEATNAAADQLPGKAEKVIGKKSGELGKIDVLPPQSAPTDRSPGPGGSPEAISILDVNLDAVFSDQDGDPEAAAVQSEFIAKRSQDLEPAAAQAVIIENGQRPIHIAEAAPAIAIDQTSAVNFEVSDAMTDAVEHGNKAIDASTETGIGLFEIQGSVKDAKTETPNDKPVTTAAVKLQEVKITQPKVVTNIKTETVRPTAKVQEINSGIKIIERAQKIVEKIQTPARIEASKPVRSRVTETSRPDRSPARTQALETKMPSPSQPALKRDLVVKRFQAQRNEQQIRAVRPPKEAAKPSPRTFNRATVMRNTPQARVQATRTVNRESFKVTPVEKQTAKITQSAPKPISIAVTGAKASSRAIPRIARLSSELQALSKLVTLKSSPVRLSPRKTEAGKNVITFKPVSVTQDKEETLNNNNLYERELALAA